MLWDSQGVRCNSQKAAVTFATSPAALTHFSKVAGCDRYVIYCCKIIWWTSFCSPCVHSITSSATDMTDEVDVLFGVRNGLHIGNYQVCVSDAQSLEVNLTHP